MDIAQLQEAGLGVYFRPRDLEPFGISHRRLMGLVAEGLVDNLGNGLYRLSEVEATEVETIAMVAAAIPNAVMCPADGASFPRNRHAVASRDLDRSGPQGSQTRSPARPGACSPFLRCDANLWGNPPVGAGGTVSHHFASPNRRGLFPVSQQAWTRYSP